MKWSCARVGGSLEGSSNILENFNRALSIFGEMGWSTFPSISCWLGHSISIIHCRASASSIVRQHSYFVLMMSSSSHDSPCQRTCYRNRLSWPMTTVIRVCWRDFNLQHLTKHILIKLKSNFIIYILITKTTWLLWSIVKLWF